MRSLLSSPSSNLSAAVKIRLVLDNLNTHNEGAFYEPLPADQAPPEGARLAQRFVFFYTPKAASWLNMIEIEFRALACLCPGTLEARRISTQACSRSPGSGCRTGLPMYLYRIPLFTGRIYLGYSPGYSSSEQPDFVLEPTRIAVTGSTTTPTNELRRSVIRKGA
ncbi:MAG: hypothetical protein DCC55_24070 [Chloroflexi bacterium]|nr:MAG: hypothetical protein DCC55_24070 [Chloroflexota bacterium]